MISLKEFKKRFPPEKFPVLYRLHLWYRKIVKAKELSRKGNKT